MSLTKTPICDFGKKADDFRLKSTENKILSLNELKGEKGTLIMFICNHCPYVKAVIKDIAEDCKNLENFGIKSVAICSNDQTNYPEDSFENMIIFAKKHNFSFPYLIDDTQNVAKKYEAVCTPDFFGFNGNNELQYRGRLEESKMEIIPNARKELLEAMMQVSETGSGPKDQIPSIGCSIKWKE